ncbi:MAG: tetratricopeptide repeat protein [bacterium]|nr:tetratricopeptide repeat protein [bacterium]
MMRLWRAVALGALVAPLSVAWTAPEGRPPIRLPEVVIVGLPVAEPTEAKEPVGFPATGPARELPREVKEPVDVASLQEAGRTLAVSPAPGCTYRSSVTTAVAKVFLQDEAQYKLGLYRIQHGQPAEAIGAFESLLANYPASSWRTGARYWIGEARLALGDADRAMASFEAAEAEPPRQRLADYAIYASAWLHVRRGEHALALEKLDRLSAQYRTSHVMPAAFELRSIAHANLGEFDLASKASRHIAQIYPGNRRAAVARFWQAESAYRTGAFEEAWEAYQSFLARHPRHPRSAEALYGLGWTGLALGDGHRALDAFMRFEERYPRHRLLPSVRYGLVRSALASGRPDLARSRLALIKKTTPGHWATAALAALADADFNSGRHEEALAAYRAIAAAGSGGPYELVGLLRGAESALALERYDEALSIYDTALLRPLNEEVYMTLLVKRGVALYESARYREAAVTFGEAADLGHESPAGGEARWLQAESLYQARELGQARAIFRALKPDGPRGAEALFGLAWVEADMGNLNEARALLDRVALGRQDHPLAPAARLKAASLVADAKGYVEAAERLKALLVAYPESDEAPRAAWKIGLMLTRAGKFRSAANAHAAFLARYPENDLADDAQFELAMNLYRSDAFGRARVALKRLIGDYRTSPHLPKALLTLGDTYYNESDYASAEDAYRQVVKLYPTDAAAVEADYGIVLTHLRRDAWEDFLTGAERFLAAHPDHPLSVTLAFQVGDSAASRNERAQAIAAFERAVRLFPKSDLADDALFRIGELTRADGRESEAAEVFKRLLSEYPKSHLAVDAHFVLAELYEGERRWEEALTHARAVIAAGSGSGRLQAAAIIAGRSLVHGRKPSAAAEAFQMAVNAGPEQPIGRRAALELGDLEVGRKRYSQALLAYQVAAQADEPSVAVQGNYGTARMLEATGDRQTAVAAYLKVFYLYPKFRSLGAKSMLSAADGYAALGRQDLALSLYKKLLAEYPKEPAAQEARTSLKAAGEAVREER